MGIPLVSDSRWRAELHGYVVAAGLSSECEWVELVLQRRSQVMITQREGRGIPFLTGRERKIVELFLAKR